MGLQKYRTDKAVPQSDGSIAHYANWIGGPTLAKVSGARVTTLHGEPTVTAYVTGEPDSFFSLPAKFYLFGKVLNGYFTRDDNGNTVVRHCYY